MSIRKGNFVGARQHATLTATSPSLTSMSQRSLKRWKRASFIASGFSSDASITSPYNANRSFVSGSGCNEKESRSAMNSTKQTNAAHTTIRIDRHTDMTDGADFLERVIEIMLLIHLELRNG